MNKDRTVWVDTSIFLVLKRFQNSILVSMRRKKKMLLWFTWLHLNDQKWSLGWSRTKPAHGLHGGARLKLRIRLPCKSHFPNMSCKICPYWKLQKYSKPALMYHRIQNSEDCALHSISSYWNKHIRMKKIHHSCQIVQSVFSQSVLF